MRERERKEEKKEKKELPYKRAREGHRVRSGYMQSYRDRGTKGLWPGSVVVTSRYFHLYVMAVLSGARVVRALLMCVAASCKWAA